MWTSAKRPVSKSGFEVQTTTPQWQFWLKNNGTWAGFEKKGVFRVHLLLLISFNGLTVFTEYLYETFAGWFLLICILKVKIKKILPQIGKICGVHSVLYIGQCGGLNLIFKSEIYDQSTKYLMRILTWESWKLI